MLLSNFSGGVNQYLPAFGIQDKEFVSLENATVRRGVVSKKLGSSLLGQLQLSTSPATLGTTTVSGTFSGTITTSPFSAFVPLTLSVTVGATTYTDDGLGDVINGATTFGAFNYATGALTLFGVAASTSVVVSVGVYPGLPVMGIGTFQSATFHTNFFLIVFDTSFAYTFNYSTRQFSKVSFYAMNSLTPNPVEWFGTDYQQFDFENYEDVLFITNGQSALNFKFITNITSIGVNLVTVTIAGNGLIAGDQIFFYEVSGMTQINGLVGTVTIAGNPTFTCTLSGPPVTLSPYTANGIAQYLTSSVANPTANGIRIYLETPTYSGFQNFAPPIISSTLGQTVYYITGAKLIIKYGNRLLLLGTTLTASNGSVIEEVNTIRYSQVNSALYTIDPTCWWETPQGSGGFIQLAGNQDIVSAEISYEQLIIGLSFSYQKVVSTGNFIQPFISFVISNVYGSICPFSSVLLDNAVLGINTVGITLATTNDVQRIDEMTIPDATQQISRESNGLLRVCCVRDYLQQLIYFTFPTQSLTFPSRTIVLNYIESNWSFYNETFTCYGQYLEQQDTATWNTEESWSEIPSWGDLSGSTGTVQVAGGTPTGAVLLKGNALFNQPYMIIQAVTPNVSFTALQINNHNLTQGQYIFIERCLGTTALNNVSTLVVQVIDANNIQVAALTTGTYGGLGIAAVSDNFLIQTKEFAPNWAKGMGGELTTLRLLLGTTPSGLISGYVSSNFIPFSTDNFVGDAILLQSVIGTGPDTNLGLTGLQYQQTYIWHRLPVLVTGQTLQLSLFLSSDQMQNTTYCQGPVVLAALLLDITPKGAIF